jgi:hypothetical protein
MRIERGRRFRIGLVLAYAVLAVWAQAGDHHGHEAAARTECDAACRDPNPHYSGHPSANLDRLPSDCPACQLRSNLHAPTTATPALGGQIVDRADVIEPIAPTVQVVGLPCCRAPPRA